nr:F-box/FBD/LRR-repeat protein At1g13570-like [Coffea arabica]
MWGEQLHDLLSLENLHLHYAYFKSLDAGGIPAKITTTLIHLKVVKLEYLCFEEVNEIAVLLCLLRSSPNLEELEILVYKVDEYAEGQASNFLDVQEYSQLTLNQLRQVKLQNISVTRSEMEIIKLLLKKSSILEKMLIKQAPMKENIKNKVTEIGILKQVTRFHRPSPRAAVIYEDPIIS